MRALSDKVPLVSPFRRSRPYEIVLWTVRRRPLVRPVGYYKRCGALGASRATLEASDAFRVELCGTLGEFLSRRRERFAFSMRVVYSLLVGLLRTASVRLFFCRFSYACHIARGLVVVTCARPSPARIHDSRPWVFTHAEESVQKQTPRGRVRLLCNTQSCLTWLFSCEHSIATSRCRKTEWLICGAHV